MALKVGELYGELSLKTDKFDRGIDDSGKKMSAMASAAKSTGNVAANVFTAAVGGAVALGVSLANVGLDYNRLQQSSRAALTTLLGGAEAANAQMDKLDEFARNSPFAKQVFIQAQQQLIGFGMSADKVLPTLDAIQQAVAATGGSNQQISELTGIIAKIGASAKITAEDLNMFGERGVDAATLIGSQMGMTGQEIRESITKGTLDADKAVQALTDGMQAKFGGATAGIKMQMDGAADRVKGAWRDIGSAIATPFVDPKGGGYLVVWTNLVADNMRVLEGKVKGAVAILDERFGALADGKIKQASENIKTFITNLDLSKINSSLDTMGKYAPQIAGVATALLAVGGNNLLLGKLGLSLNPVVGGIVAMVAASPELRKVAIDMFNGLSPLVPMLGTLAVQVLDFSNYLMRNAAPALGEVLEGVVPLAVALGGDLIMALMALVDAGYPLVDMLTMLLGVVADMPPGVLLAVGAFLALKGPISGLTPMLSAAGEAFTRFRERAAIQAHLGNTTQAMGAMSTASMGLQSAVGKVGTALKTAFLSNPIGIAVMGLTTVLGFYAQQAADAQAITDTYKAALMDTTDAVKATADAMNEAIAGKDQRNFLDKMFGDDPKYLIDLVDQLGVSTQDLTGYINGEEEAMNRVKDAALAKAEANRADTDTKGDVIKQSERYLEGLEAEREGMEEAKIVTDNLAIANAAAGGAADTHRVAAEQLRNEIREGTDANLSAAEAALRLKDATASVTEAIQKKKDADANAKAVQESATATEEEKTAAVEAATKATGDAERAILQNVQASLYDIDAKKKAGASNEDLYDSVMAARQSFIDQRMAMGDTRAAAMTLADGYGLIPRSVLTDVDMIDLASKKIDHIIQSYNGRSVNIMVNTVTGTQTNGFGFNSRMAADGGKWEGGRWDGVTKRFGNGGFNSQGQHVKRESQMVRGGANILWGEPETVWETYISGKPSMRGRNVRLLDETASRFGYKIVPRYGRAMANGGSIGSTPVSTGSQLPPVTIVADSVMAKALGDEAAREFVRVLEDHMAVYGLGG